MGHSLLMGRRTYDSIGRALPGRRNLVLTRNPAWHAPGCDTVGTVDDACRRAAGTTLFVIGGAEVFLLCWPIVGRLELTEVHAEVGGDTFLEGFDRSEWREVAREPHGADAQHACAFDFVTLVRR
jgi:dihydrofolate reductase